MWYILRPLNLPCLWCQYLVELPLQRWLLRMKRIMRWRCKYYWSMFKTCRSVVGRSGTCVIKSRIMEMVHPHYCICLSQVMWTLRITTRYFPNNIDLAVTATVNLCRLFFPVPIHTAGYATWQVFFPILLS